MTTYQVELTVEVTDEKLLRAFTSGFMADNAPVTSRVEKVLLMAAPLEGINGLRIDRMTVVLDDGTDIVCSHCPYVQPEP